MDFLSYQAPSGFEVERRSGETTAALSSVSPAKQSIVLDEHLSGHRNSPRPFALSRSRLAVYDLSLPVKVVPILSAMMLASSFPMQGQVLQQTVVVPQTLGTPPPERRWAPGAVVEVPPIFAAGPFELRRQAAADPFTKYLERRKKRNYSFLRWPAAIPVELSRHPDKFCAVDYLAPGYREAVEQFDDLRFQFVVEAEPDESFG